MKLRFLRSFLLFVLFSAPLRAGEDKIRVASFSTILTEIAERVGGDHVAVTGIIKPGVDPHEFQPRPADLKIVTDAQLILLSAKHMEGYVDKVKEATRTKGVLVQVGDQFSSLRMPGESGKVGAVDDPHWWHSIDNVKRATKVVQAEITNLAPADAPDFVAHAAAYIKELEALDRWARSEIALLPRDQRKLVTSHDAFQYFARAYGFTIHPIEGITHDDQPSSRKVADLIATIKGEHVKAVFLEDTQNPKVTTEITRDSGARIGGTLYADGLAEGEGATYTKMFRHNVTTIVTALK